MSEMTTRRRWKPAALVALAYFVTARLSLLVAIPPGYSTIVWPAAGIALSALLVWGLDLWPGVLAGSCLANAAMVWSRGDTGAAPYLLSIWFGAGAAAQAFVAATLIHRACDGRDPLAEESDLFRFLMLGGPLACLVASSWAAAGMLLFGQIASREMLFSWATWWIGDSIGVIGAAPLVLLWSGRGPASSRRGKIAVSAAFAAILAGVAAVQVYSIRNEETTVRSAAAETLQDVSVTLRVGLAGHLDALQSTADLFASDKKVAGKEFARFAHGVLERHPGMLALKWRPRVSSARAPEHYPILFIEPSASNEKALGMDLGPDSPIRDAAARALESGKPAASAPVSLTIAPGQAGIVVMVPVRASGADAPSGLVEGAFLVGDMMEDLLAGVDKRNLGVRVYDDTPPGPPHLLYERGSRAAPSLEVVSVTGDFAGRRWRFELLPTAKFEARVRAPLSWFVLFGALLFTYLVGWVVLTLYGRGFGARLKPKRDES